MKYILHGSSKISFSDISANLTFEQVSERVELESAIPKHVSSAVKDYIWEKLQDASEAVVELLTDLPPELVEYAETILDIIKVLISG